MGVPTMRSDQDAKYGIYRGEVVLNTDPESRGRVKLRIPQVLGNASTQWAEPSVASRAPVVAIGTAVWVQFAGGDVSKPVYMT